MLKLLCAASIVVDFAGFQSLIALGALWIHRVLSMLSLLSANFVVVQSLIFVQLFVIPWTATHEASLYELANMYNLNLRNQAITSRNYGDTTSRL